MQGRLDRGGGQKGEFGMWDEANNDKKKTLHFNLEDFFFVLHEIFVFVSPPSFSFTLPPPLGSDSHLLRILPLCCAIFKK